jgi:hypothetical protein
VQDGHLGATLLLRLACNAATCFSGGCKALTMSRLLLPLQLLLPLLLLLSAELRAQVGCRREVVLGADERATRERHAKAHVLRQRFQVFTKLHYLQDIMLCGGLRKRGSC